MMHLCGAVSDCVIKQFRDFPCRSALACQVLNPSAPVIIMFLYCKCTKPWIWYVSVFVFWLLGCAVSDCDGQTLCYLCDSRWADRSSMAGGPGRSGRSTTAPRPWWCCRRCWPGRTRAWRKPLHVHKHKFICEQNKKSVSDLKLKK